MSDRLLVLSSCDCSCHNRDLHSFPTRRSSDLIRMLLDYLVTGGVLRFNPASSVRGPKYTIKKGKTPVLTPQEARTLIDGRSEEHTSELQSLRHLVCRLLLEKKKNNNTRQTIKL